MTVLREGAEVVPDWAAGYSLTTPCIWEGCPREIAWWGNQHGCIKGHACDFHLRYCLEEWNLEVSRCGFLRCGICRGVFHSVHLYFKAVRV